DEYAAFLNRVVRAYGRRVASGDIEALRDMLALTTELETAIDHAVFGLRRFGYSWTEIANRIGVTRQAAQQRWGTQPTAEAPPLRLAPRRRPRPGSPRPDQTGPVPTPRFAHHGHAADRSDLAGQAGPRPRPVHQWR